MKCKYSPSVMQMGCILYLMSAYDNNIVLLQDQILLRQNGKSVPKEQVDGKLFGLFQFLDGLTCITFVYEQLCDFPDICTVVIQNAALSLILFHEPGADDTGRDRNRTDTEVGNADRHDTSQSRDRINITVTNGQKCRHAPPDTAESIPEDCGLCFMFDTVHAETAGKHQDKHDKDGRDDLIPLFIQNGCDNVERIIFGVEPEQMKDPRNTKHTENDKAGQEKDRNDRQKVDNTIKGK